MNEEIEISPIGNLLIYKKDYSKEIIKNLILKYNLAGLRIFAILNEDRLTNLDFLEEYTFLQELSITSIDDYDFGFLQKLGNLKSLDISKEGKNKIDLSNLINLTSLGIHWRKGKILGLENCRSINQLCLIEYNEDNFNPVSSLKNLTELKIKTSAIKSLDGIQEFKKLNYLELGYCKKLVSINQITELTDLKLLEFDLCTKIIEFDSLGNLANLEVLKIDDCKDIKSIRFVDNLKYLKQLTFLGSTNVLDGDLIPTKNIEKVFYRPRKHYNL